MHNNCNDQHIVPAPVRLRVYAFFIDIGIYYLLLGTVAMIIGLVVIFAGISYMGKEDFINFAKDKAAEYDEYDKALDAQSNTLRKLLHKAWVFVSNKLWLSLYFAVFESSKWQASPGKRIFRIYVTDQKYNRLSFPKAYIRAFIKLLGSVLDGSGYLVNFIITLLTDKYQSIHDLVIHTYVVQKADKPLNLVFEPRSIVMNSIKNVIRQVKDSIVKVNIEQKSHIEVSQAEYAASLLDQLENLQAKMHEQPQSLERDQASEILASAREEVSNGNTSNLANILSNLSVKAFNLTKSLAIEIGANIVADLLMKAMQ